MIGEDVRNIAAGFVLHRRAIEPLAAEPTGVLALVLTFLVPLIIVSLPVMVWRLASRRRRLRIAMAWASKSVTVRS